MYHKVLIDIYLPQDKPFNPFPAEMRMEKTIMHELCKFPVGKFTRIMGEPIPTEFAPDVYVAANDVNCITMRIVETNTKPAFVPDNEAQHIDVNAMRTHLISTIHNLLGCV